MKSTNYYDTFIEVAEDCPVTEAEVPLQRGGKQTVAIIEYDLISRHPYQHTSDDVLFRVHAMRHNIPQEQQAKEREKFFSRGQPCFRSSPLTKRYGWGVHSNSEGKVALYAVDSNDYKKLAADQHLKHLKAMRSKIRIGTHTCSSSPAWTTTAAPGPPTLPQPPHPCSVLSVFTGYGRGR